MPKIKTKLKNILNPRSKRPPPVDTAGLLYNQADSPSPHNHNDYYNATTATTTTTITTTTSNNNNNNVTYENDGEAAHVRPQIPSEHKDRVRQRQPTQIKSHKPKPLKQKRQDNEPPFVDMLSFKQADENFGPLVRKCILPKTRPSGKQPIGALTNYVLCCMVPELRTECDYAELFNLLKRNDTRTKTTTVESLQSVLLKTDPSRLLEFDKKIFLVEGIDIVLNEFIRNVHHGRVREVLLPLIYSIMSLTNICIANRQIGDDMQLDIFQIYSKHSEQIKKLSTVNKEVFVLQEMIQQMLEKDMNVIFLVVDWSSYFRDVESREEFVSLFPGLKLRDRITSLFLLGNLTCRRENREDTTSLICHILKNLKDESFPDSDQKTIQAQYMYIMAIVVHVFQTEPTQRLQNMSSKYTQILQLLLENKKIISLSSEIQSLLLFNKTPELQEWIFRSHNFISLDMEKATEILVSYLARNLQLNIDLCSSDIQHSETKSTPYWMSKLGQCLHFRAKITILFPSRNCLHQGITSDYKRNVADKIGNKWHLNELDCLMRLHNTEGHRNVVSLLCFQCVPMPIFYVVQDNDSTNLLEYLIHKKNECGRIKMQTIINMCIQAADAITFVHGKGMVHRDITADSFVCFMQGENICVQLSVFRMATTLWEDGDAPRRTKIDIECDKIPIRWSAPESLIKGEFSFYSDVWMLGVLICEIFNHGTWPYTEVHLEKDNISTDELIEMIVFSRLPPSEAFIPKPISDLVRKCLDHDFMDNRCSVEQVKEKLKNFSKEYHNSMHYGGTQDSWDHFIPNKTKLSISDRQRKNQMKPERDIPLAILEKRQSISPEKEFFEKTTKLQNNMRNIAIDGTDIHTYSEPTRTRDDKVNPPVYRVSENVNEDFMKNVFQYLQEDITILCLKEEPCLSQNLLTYRCVDGSPMYTYVYERYTLEEFDKYLDIIFKLALTVQALHERDIIIRCLRLQDVWVSFSEQRVYIPRLGAFRRLPTEESHSDQIKDNDRTDLDLLYWSPPEAIKEGLYSKASDVWSFAMLISQICCILSIEMDHYEEGHVELKSTPFSHVKESELFCHIAKGNIPIRFPCCPEWLYELLTKCWEVDRSKRPSAQKIIDVFLKEKPRLNELFRKPQENTGSSSDSYDYPYLRPETLIQRRNNTSHRDNDLDVNHKKDSGEGEASDSADNEVLPFDPKDATAPMEV